MIGTLYHYPTAPLMKITRLLVLFLIILTINGLIAWLSNLPQDAGIDVPDGKISSVSFAPFREGQSPLTKVYPSTEQIDADLKLLADQTHSIRTYASLDGMQSVPGLARKYGLTMIQGAWIGSTDKTNQAEIAQLIKDANDYPDVIKRVIVGNEVLLRGELKPEQLLAYIRQVKQAVKQPVSYADVWSFYLRYPEIAKEVDFFTVHILPYWEDEPLNIDTTAAHVDKNYQRIRQTYANKPILIGESGWPSAGRQRGWAIPSVVNEAKYVRSLVQLANNNHFDYNIVEAFNQPWKSKLEGVVGANWGLYSADRQRVFPLTGAVTENPLWLQQLFYAGLITLLLISSQVKKLVSLTPLRLLMFLGFTQLLSALLVNQLSGHWYTSYNLIERLHALFISGLSALLAALILQHTLSMLRHKISSQTGIWIHYLMLAFVAIALYRSQGLALSGRYLSIPYPVTYIPVAGLLGFKLIRHWVKDHNLSLAPEINDLFGNQFLPTQWLKSASFLLTMTGIFVIALETVVVMNGSNYEQAYPFLTDRIYEAFMETTHYSQLMGWSLLITAAVIRLPLRNCAYALILMIPAISIGETVAFMTGHDFIESYPSLGERLWTALIYTFSNQQLLLWFASLLVLALPLWHYQEKQPTVH
jgi:exo-beta-1,3-glucanase (GH17 family)